MDPEFKSLHDLHLPGQTSAVNLCSFPPHVQPSLCPSADLCFLQAGEVQCSSPECPKLPCLHQVTDPGACCPRCRGNYITKNLYPRGEIFVSLSVFSLSGCVYGGEERTEGSSWFADSTPCMTCMCVDGVTTCSEVHCLSPCINFINVPGECCPVCAGKKPRI